ncbi:cupin domain-containing protein [Sphingomonas sp.]|uniref:cupin domain-containing protein n=1 Tax=Sphingomonas sp. TaxID=28214 RepID=UPI00289A0E3E|nr:cupin domain-containing protein [Sphingomonas sp.]
MSEQRTNLVAVQADEAAPRSQPSNYPEPFASIMAGRVKRPLGDLFGLQSFGVNHVALPPGAVSALHHRHSVQDEFVMVLTGQITLVHDAGEAVLTPGMCAGFVHDRTAHHLINRSDVEATYVEVGDRQAGDEVSYPRDDLKAERTGEGWQFSHKDGTAY